MKSKAKKLASMILFLAITSAALTGCAKPAETQKESSAPVSTASAASKTEESTPESSVNTPESTNESSVVEPSEETNPYPTLSKEEAEKQLSSLQNKTYDEWKSISADDVAFYCYTSDVSSPYYGYLYGVAGTDIEDYYYGDGEDEHYLKNDIVIIEANGVPRFIDKDNFSSLFNVLPKDYKLKDTDMVYHVEVEKILPLLPEIPEEEIIEPSNTTYKNDYVCYGRSIYDGESTNDDYYLSKDLQLIIGEYKQNYYVVYSPGNEYILGLIKKDKIVLLPKDYEVLDTDTVYDDELYKKRKEEYENRDYV